MLRADTEGIAMRQETVRTTARNIVQRAQGFFPEPSVLHTLLSGTDHNLATVGPKSILTIQPVHMVAVVLVTGGIMEFGGNGPIAVVKQPGRGVGR
jgi:hypothetical protein